MRLGFHASALRRGSTLANVVGNGTFASSDGWSNLGGGKAITGGKLVFTAVGSYDGAIYDIAPVAGSYYELTYTISGYSSGHVNVVLGGGTTLFATVRSANGTYVERILINTGNNQLFMWSQDVAGTFSIDDISLIGPYTTATVGGA